VKYLAAQRVRHGSGNVGINSYVYRVEPDLSTLWSSIDQSPGTLISSRSEVEPGFNAVLSYLDVVVADAAIGHLPEAFESIDGAIAMANLPLTRSVHGIEIRFGAVIGLSGEPARLEFHALARALEAILASDSAAAVARPKIRLTRRIEGSKHVFGREGGSISITVDTDMAFDFKQAHGDSIVPYVAEALTGMSLHELLQAGGVDIVDDRGQLVLTWPAKAA
jgi:hypothetical protein